MPQAKEGQRLEAGLVMNHASVRQRADMAEFLAICAARGIGTVSIWGDEIDKIGEDRALTLIHDLGLRVEGYNRIGPFDEGGLARAEAELERAKRFGADHVFLFTGGLREDEALADGVARAEAEIARLLDLARRIGVRLALEPLHPMLTGDRTVLNSLAQANDLCDRLGEGIGIVVDVYHLWWDPELAHQIARAGAADRLYGFHVNDWLRPTRHLLTDRGMMGDGIIDLAAIHGMMRQAGFTKLPEVEIFSEDWWQRPPEEVIDLSISRCRQIFG